MTAASPPPVASSTGPTGYPVPGRGDLPRTGAAATTPSMTWSGATTPVRQRPPLVRATSRSAEMPTPWIAGVCSGLSVHLRIPVGAVRASMMVLSCLFGAGLLLYMWLAMSVPVDGMAPAEPRTDRLARTIRRVGTDRTRTTARNQLLLAGIVALVVAFLLILVTTSQVIDSNDVLGIFALVIGLSLVWSQGTRLDRSRSVLVFAIIAAGVILLMIGLFVLAQGIVDGLRRRGDQLTPATSGVVIGAVLMIGILVALVPLWLRISSALNASQREQVRETERADIAAHLHDSVLQTLTLIRGAAEDPVRVRALALSQERELRSWLYTGHEEASDSLSEALREAVGQVESTYGVAIDVVTVGDTVPGPRERALVAAAAEAATNAVRHAALPISVYAEVLPESVEIFVKDAGKGFDLDAIPEDRHGVRNSIIGRVERVGGTVQIRSRDQGTEIHLRGPRTPCDPALIPHQQAMEDS